MEARVLRLTQFFEQYCNKFFNQFAETGYNSRLHMGAIGSRLNAGATRARMKTVTVRGAYGRWGVGQAWNLRVI